MAITSITTVQGPNDSTPKEGDVRKADSSKVGIGHGRSFTYKGANQCQEKAVVIFLAIICLSLFCAGCAGKTGCFYALIPFTIATLALGAFYFNWWDIAEEIKKLPCFKSKSS